MSRKRKSPAGLGQGSDQLGGDRECFTREAGTLQANEAMRARLAAVRWGFPWSLRLSRTEAVYRCHGWQRRKGADVVNIADFRNRRERMDWAEKAQRQREEWARQASERLHRLLDGAGWPPLGGDAA